MPDPHLDTPYVTPPPPMRDGEISLWEVLAVVLRRRLTIATAVIGMSVLVVGYALLSPPSFTTSAMFRPQGTQVSASQITALASQFGITVPGGGEEASPAFYAEILTSREILGRAAMRTYPVEGEGDVLIKDLLEIEDDTEALRDEAAINWLREQAVSVSVGRETGTVVIDVVTEWPDLSRDIASQLLAEISRFNLSTRQSQAAAERVFIESRMRDAEAELVMAEDSLRVFLEANRQFGNSPLLQLRHDELQRRVMQRQTVLTTLIQSFEEARISEVRDTPVITVLQSPFLPPGPDDRRLVLMGLLGIVLGGLLGVVLAFVVEAVRTPAGDDPARADFQRALDAVMRSIPFVGGRRAA